MPRTTENPVRGTEHIDALRLGERPAPAPERLRPEQAVATLIGGVLLALVVLAAVLAGSWLLVRLLLEP